MKAAARFVYGALGVLAMGLGLIAVFKPALALSEEAYSPLAAHLIQEQGAEGVFIGLMALWCFFNLERRRPVHLALLVFAFLVMLSLLLTERRVDTRASRS